MSQLEFTNNWFELTAKNVWDHLIPQISPRTILEVGSYEGASTCYLIETLAPRHAIEIHCIDSWEGGVEHRSGGPSASDMSAVQSRFSRNTGIAIAGVANSVTLVAHKGLSDAQLARLLCENRRSYFDFVYIDGSHEAPDVLCDAVLGFRLLKIGGVMAFDDYLWAENLPYGKDPIRCPKPAIDAFTNLYCRKLQVLQAPLYQLYIRKLAD